MSADSESPISLRAHFDGTIIRLDEPYDLPENAQLLVTIVSPGTTELSISGWKDLSAEGLARAYGENEPEYSDADIRS